MKLTCQSLHKIPRNTSTSRYHSRMVIEAIEIHKHRNNFKRKEETLKLDKMWSPDHRNTKADKNRN